MGKNDTQTTKHYETYLWNNDTKKVWSTKGLFWQSDNTEELRTTERQRTMSNGLSSA